MMQFEADYFDGQSSQAHPVTVSISAEYLQVVAASFEISYALRDMTVYPPAGKARGIISFAGGAELHTHDQQAILYLSRSRLNPERFAYRLEKSWRYVFVTLLIAVAVVFVGLRWGVPWAASAVAQHVPAEWARNMGEDSLMILDKTYVSPSALPAATTARLESALRQYCQQQVCPTYQLNFRSSKVLEANAFALPDGSIVVTDDLVKLAKNDQEIIAIIAHEFGHIQYQHSLRMALQSAGAMVILVAITGDVSSFSDLAAGLPSLLMQSGYSRDMEREADEYAWNWLKRANLSGQYFVDMLSRLDKDGEKETGLLSSHPATPERVLWFKQKMGAH